MSNRLNTSMHGWLTDWLNHWLNERMNERMNYWVDELMNVELLGEWWMNEWRDFCLEVCVNQRVNEWMTGWLKDWPTDWIYRCVGEWLNWMEWRGVWWDRLTASWQILCLKHAYLNFAKTQEKTTTISKTEGFWCTLWTKRCTSGNFGRLQASRMLGTGTRSSTVVRGMSACMVCGKFSKTFYEKL